MVTGDHDFEAELTREAREQAELDHHLQQEQTEVCQFGWWVPKDLTGHICRLPKGHQLPHRCTLNTTCRATYEG